MTRLHQAVFDGNLEIVKDFVSDGDNVNERIKLSNQCNESLENVTPLYLASQQGFEDIYKFLVENGADIFIDAYNTKKRKHYSIESIALLHMNFKIAGMIRLKKLGQINKFGIYAPLMSYEERV